ACAVVLLLHRPPSPPPLFPYTTLFRSFGGAGLGDVALAHSGSDQGLRDQLPIIGDLGCSHWCRLVVVVQVIHPQPQGPQPLGFDAEECFHAGGTDLQCLTGVGTGDQVGGVAVAVLAAVVASSRFWPPAAEVMSGGCAHHELVAARDAIQGGGELPAVVRE